MTPTSRNIATLVVAAALAAPTHAYGQSADDPPSTEGALFLLLPVGAKAVSLARAMTAMDGPESVFWNPAGIASVEGSQIVLVRGDHFAGSATALSSLLSRPGLGTVGFSYFLLDFGEQDVTDVNGNYLGTLSTRDHLGVATAAAELTSGLSVGASFKVIQFRQSCRGIADACTDAGTTATTYAMDGGFQAEPTPRLRIGGMLAHVGPRYQVLNSAQADPLPWRVRLAAAYDVVSRLVESEAVRGWLAVEVQDRLRELGSISVYVGSELMVGSTDALFLRAGYGVSELDQEDGASVGLGLRYQRFDLAFAKSLAVSSLSVDTEPVHVTFSYLF